MTRKEAIKVIRKMLAYTDLSVRANLTADMVDACHLAIDTMRKYQKIKEIVENYNGFTDGTLEHSKAFAKIVEVVEDGNIY